MVLAGEGLCQPGGKGGGRIQPPDSDRGCGHLRDSTEESSVTELFSWPLQRDAGKRRARVSSDVCKRDARRLVLLRQRIRSIRSHGKPASAPPKLTKDDGPPPI